MASDAHIGANAYRLSGQGLVSRTVDSCVPPLSAYRILSPSIDLNSGSIDVVNGVLVETPLCSVADALKRSVVATGPRGFRLLRSSSTRARRSPWSIPGRCCFEILGVSGPQLSLGSSALRAVEVKAGLGISRVRNVPTEEGLVFGAVGIGLVIARGLSPPGRELASVRVRDARH